MGGHDHNADNRGEPRGKHRAENAHVAGEDKHIVQNDVGEAAGGGGRHGQGGAAVVADKAHQHGVEDKGGGKQQQHPQIGVGHSGHLTLRPQQTGQRPGEQQARQHKQQGDARGQPDAVGEHVVGRLVFPPAFADGVFGGSAHAQHQPGAVNKIIGRDGQVQGRQPGGAQTLGHEKGVRQNVAGDGQHRADT